MRDNSNPCLLYPVLSFLIRFGVRFRPQQSPALLQVHARATRKFRCCLSPISGLVASRFVCKSFEGFLGPVGIHAIKDAVEDAFTTVSGSKGTHGPDAPTYFHKEPFNHVGSTHPLPMSAGRLKECQQFFQVGFQTGHGLGGLSSPAAFPLPETLERGRAV